MKLNINQLAYFDTGMDCVGLFPYDDVALLLAIKHSLGTRNAFPEG